MISGKSCCEFITLYRKDGQPLSAHIVLTPLTGGSESHSLRCRKLQDLESCIGNNNIKKLIEVELYGILTIRSASVVGNAKATGIGLLGLDNIVPNTRQKILDAIKLT